MRALLLSVLLALSGCALMPSKWDENQARVVTDIRQEASDFDCKQPIGPQLIPMEKNIQWFMLYSDYKKADDLNKMMTTLQTTITELQTRAAKGSVSPTYCQLKQEIIADQVDLIGHTISGSL